MRLCSTLSGSCWTSQRESCVAAYQIPVGLYKERVWCGRFVVAVSWIERSSKINSEEISSSAGGQSGGGALGENDMVSNLVVNSTKTKPPYSLLVNKSQFRTSYDDYKENIAVQTAQDGIPRRVARVKELMALSNRRTIAILYRSSRELSELQLWKGLGRIVKVQRDNETLIVMLTSYSVVCNHSCAGVPFVLSPITWPA